LLLAGDSKTETVPSWIFRVFYDAECPLCAREIALIRRIDRGRGQVDLVDLSAPDFDASHFGLEQGTIEARIHGQWPDGRIVEGVDVFVALYEAVGLGWITAPAKWPGFRWLLDRAYLWFARNRLRLTGRTPKTCSLPEVGSAVSSKDVNATSR
jgi:predicted DCC family thiol-disulfide oxidoreductase YuxK